MRRVSQIGNCYPRSSFFYLLCICFLQFHADLVHYAKIICICQKKVVPLHPIMFQFTREEAESPRSQFAMLNDDSISSQNARTSRSSEDLKSQIVTSSGEENMSPQNATTSPQRRPASALPYAFTENGIAMLSSVLRSSHR